MFTLENGVEYLLDDLDPEATYSQFVDFVADG